jgi:hypothetical protein
MEDHAKKQLANEIKALTGEIVTAINKFESGNGLAVESIEVIHSDGVCSDVIPFFTEHPED